MDDYLFKNIFLAVGHQRFFGGDENSREVFWKILDSIALFVLTLISLEFIPLVKREYW